MEATWHLINCIEWVLLQWPRNVRRLVEKKESQCDQKGDTFKYQGLTLQ